MNNNKLPEVSLYSSTISEPIKILPRLLQKAVKSNIKAFILSPNSVRAGEIDEVLWTFAQRGFLPHGLYNEKYPERQPVLIGTLDNHNLNHSSLLATIDAMTEFDLAKYEKVIDVFDGKNPTHTELAEKRMAYYKNKGCKLNYWLQDEKGNWNTGLINNG